ncbi:uncharacterized protein [Prorops nasuta]|uniref:uncharacterized protein n=1 Tax=Prorops nasuta TaxID=863751 RepID=UPI0034D00080
MKFWRIFILTGVFVNAGLQVDHRNYKKSLKPIQLLFNKKQKNEKHMNYGDKINNFHRKENSNSFEKDSIDKNAKSITTDSVQIFYDRWKRKSMEATVKDIIEFNLTTILPWTFYLSLNNYRRNSTEKNSMENDLSEQLIKNISVLSNVTIETASYTQYELSTLFTDDNSSDINFNMNITVNTLSTPIKELVTAVDEQSIVTTENLSLIVSSTPLFDKNSLNTSNSYVYRMNYTSGAEVNQVIEQNLTIHYYTDRLVLNGARQNNYSYERLVVPVFYGWWIYKLYS